MVPVDFLSTHPYPNTWPKDASGRQLMAYRDPDSTLHDLQWLRKTLDASPYKNLEVHLTEWNASPDARDLIHDTAFMAPFIIQNNLKCLGLVDSLGFWTFTDVFEEGAAGDTLFHGGLGLINVQVLLWNYCHYKEAFARGDRSGLSLHDRYGIFEERPRSFSLCLGGLEGAYKVTEWTLDRQHGSAFDAWLRNGALESPTEADLAILRQGTGPVGSISVLEGQAEYRREVMLAPHGVMLSEFKKRYI